MMFTREKSRPGRDAAWPIRIPHGLIGRGQAGKTVLLRTARRRTLQRSLPTSGLTFDVEDPRLATELMQDSRRTAELLGTCGLPATQEAEELAIELYAGERKLVVLESREAIGQTFTHTTTTSPVDQQNRYKQHVEHLSQASLLWAVLSLPPDGSEAQEFAQFEEDLLTQRAYVRESLRLRRPDQTCAVAVVITKLDTLFDSEDEARRRLTDEALLKAVGPLVNLLQESAKVRCAVIHPVSPLGFGNTELLEPSEGSARPPGNDVERQYKLRSGAVVVPYNVVPLIAWSFAAGMLNHDVSPEDGARLTAVYQMLRDDLAALDGWQVPLKGTV